MFQAWDFQREYGVIFRLWGGDGWWQRLCWRKD